MLHYISTNNVKISNTFVYYYERYFQYLPQMPKHARKNGTLRRYPT